MAKPFFFGGYVAPAWTDYQKVEQTPLRATRKIACTSPITPPLRIAPPA